MLSNKWTFSLTSLVVLIVFGLAVCAPSVMADHGDFAISITSTEDTVRCVVRDARAYADCIGSGS